MTLRAILGVSCALACLPAVQCAAIDDDFALIQAETRVTPQGKWPDIGKVVEKAKEAAEEASKAAEAVNSTVEGAMDQAANATKTAIDMVVHTVRAGLEHILKQADALNKTVSDAVDRLVKRVETSPGLHTFEEAAQETVDATLAVYDPVVMALNSSVVALQDILKASGFLHLSQAVGDTLKQAMVPIEGSHLVMEQISQTLKGMDAKINASAGNVSADIEKDLKWIDDKLHQVVEEINSTFIPKMIESYDTLVSHIRATVEGMLPEKYLAEVIEKLNTVSPLVQLVAGHVSSPLAVLEAGFSVASGKVLETVPHSACNAVGFSLLAMAVGMCVNGMSFW